MEKNYSQYSAGKDGAIQRIIIRDILRAENDTRHLFVAYILNSDGKVVSKKTSPTVITQEFNYKMNLCAAHSFAQVLRIGLFDPTLKAPTSDDFLQTWTAGIINQHTQMKITVDKVVDQTKGGEGETKSFYQASVSSTDQVIGFGQNRFQRLPALPNTKITFEIGNWVVREATTRKMHFSELFAELGGCWSSSFLIVGFFFYQRIGGRQGKLQIFRFKGPKGRKKLLRTAGEELAMYVVGRTVDELEAQVGVASDLPNMDGLPQVTEMKSLIKEQNALFVEMSREGGAAAMRFAIARLRPRLQPLVEKHGLEWKDILPVLELVKVDTLLDALEDPDELMRMLTKECGVVGRKFAIAKLRKNR